MIIPGGQWQKVSISGVDLCEGLVAFEETVVPVDCDDNGVSDSHKTQQSAKKYKKKKQKIVPSEATADEWEVSRVAEVTEDDVCDWTNICVPFSLSRALVEHGMEKPTEIQKLTIPAAIKGRKDILGAAETGSGKTLAFALPMIYGILKHKEKTEEMTVKPHSERETPDADRLLALIITPTRELALQIKQHFLVALKYTGIKIISIVGGLSIDKQLRELQSKPEIVVGTPGRIWEIMGYDEGAYINLESLKFLAIDETDRMIEKDHFPELKSILERFSLIASNSDQKITRRQNFVFSATLSLVHSAPDYVKKRRRKRGRNFTSEEKLQNLISMVGMTDPKVVNITKPKGTASNLNEYKITTTLEGKDSVLMQLLLHELPRNSSVIIFVNSISCIKRLSPLLILVGISPLVLHANMEQRQRLKNLDKFKQSSSLHGRVLLATDVAARGLDIPSVQYIIHYQVPRTSENYVHRSGRTARAGSSGTAFLLIEPTEVKNYRKICSTLQRDEDIEEYHLNKSLVQKFKQIAKTAVKIENLEYTFTKTKKQFNWTQTAAEEMDILLDEDQIPQNYDDKESSDIRKSLRIQKKILQKLLLNTQRLSTEGGSFKEKQIAMLEYINDNSSEPVKKKKSPSKTKIQLLKSANKKN